jgi:hypothetical protein
LEQHIPDMHLRQGQMSKVIHQRLALISGKEVQCSHSTYGGYDRILKLSFVVENKKILRKEKKNQL